jgi:hypothetical protein
VNIILARRCRSILQRQACVKTIRQSIFRSIYKTFWRIFIYSPPYGGERASITRMRLSGRACCACKSPLDAVPNQKTGERYCRGCAPRHRVYPGAIVDLYHL